MDTIYLFLTTGFEEIEAIATVDILRRAGLPLVTVSVEESTEVTGKSGVTVKADKLYEEVTDFDKAEMLILPGGTLRLGEHQTLCDLLKKHNSEAKFIAAICAAPAILGQLGLLKGRKAICYPGFEDYLGECDVELDKTVVSDVNFITAAGPYYTIDFALKIVEELLGWDKSVEIAEQILYNTYYLPY